MALDILLSRAVWLRAGLSGVETGLDLAQALARLPGDVEAHAVRRLLLAAEPAVLEAIAERREELETHGKT
ncbi:hypothetical protein [Parvibaculum sp.]|uniref:hypothetical protein n=1 Tax=Parvibaculum sp. TaxID=2024848 RepID=UPI00391DC769